MQVENILRGRYQQIADGSCIIMIIVARIATPISAGRHSVVLFAILTRSPETDFVKVVVWSPDRELSKSILVSSR